MFAQSAGAETAARLRAAIAGDHREAKNRARDVYRHPFATLSFFGIEPDMTVVEIWPGRGWYSEILAPFLKGSGRLYAASWDRDLKSDYVQRTLKGYREKFVARPDVYGEVIVTELSRSKTAIAPPGSANMVLTFRNVHNWMKRGYERTIFRAMFDALKPGGVLGLVEHRGNPEVWQDPQALSGYVNEDYTIELAENVGFRLLARSEANANPKDTKDHPKGVWTLPPSLRLKDQDREKYLAIGESDRMTLKFVKPAN
ncbi:MAG: methyltransferase [Kiloniellales bacterium]